MTMKLKDAANNLARLIDQLGVLKLVDQEYHQHGNPAPGNLMRMAVRDVDESIKYDFATQALIEIAKVADYASDSDGARLKMLAWISQAARDALEGKWVEEPPRSTLKPGDVLVKAGSFPPEPGK